LPRRPDDQPLIFPILEDLVELLKTGYLKQLVDSVSGCNAIAIDDVLLQKVVVDWFTH
jgi:hypothetical protein